MDAIDKALKRVGRREQKRRQKAGVDMVHDGRPPLVPEKRRGKISQKRRQAVFNERSE